MNEAVPALFEHCVEVYQKMAADAEPMVINDINDGIAIPVWEGFTTKLFRTLNLSVPYYSKVTQHLKGMDCIRQVRRGGSTTPSVWALIQPPTMELFRTRGARDLSPSFATKATELMQLQQQVRDQGHRIGKLEGEIETLRDILISMAQKKTSEPLPKKGNNADI